MIWKTWPALRKVFSWSALVNLCSFFHWKISNNNYGVSVRLWEIGQLGFYNCRGQVIDENRWGTTPMKKFFSSSSAYVLTPCLSGSFREAAAAWNFYIRYRSRDQYVTGSASRLVLKRSRTPHLLRWTHMLLHFVRRWWWEYQSDRFDQCYEALTLLKQVGIVTVYIGSTSRWLTGLGVKGTAIYKHQPRFLFSPSRLHKR